MGKEGVKSSMVPKRPDTAPKMWKDAPGAGSYHPSILGPKNPSYGMGTSIRDKLNKEELAKPGAGAYNPSDIRTSIRPSSPNYRIGTGNRPPLSDPTPSPGPGAYNHKQLLGDATKVGMSARLNPGSTFKNPGPGTYDPTDRYTSVFGRSPSYKSGSGPKVWADNSTRRIVPGPGMYGLGSSLKGPKYGFGRDLRSSGKILSPTGPGHYHIPCSFAVTPNYLIPDSKKPFKFI